MKTTVEFPGGELEGVIKFTNAETNREAVITAIVDFNRRTRTAQVARCAGTCADLMTPAELRVARRRGGAVDSDRHFVLDTRVWSERRPGGAEPDRGGSHQRSAPLRCPSTLAE